jgi:hypothetical protein
MIPKSTCCSNIKSKKILLIKVNNDKHVHDDSKALPGLIENIIKSDNSMIPIGKLFTDDEYMRVTRFLNYRICFS